MTAYALPPPLSDEAARLETLRRYAILDTPREALFDRYVFAVAQLFRAPIAAITLVDENRVWMKSKVGLRPQEISRDQSFCAQTILGPHPLVVEDASLDARFQHHVMVQQQPYVRFYAGVPLISPDGYALGCLCVADLQARTAQPKQLWHLAQMGASVMDGLETRRAALAVG